ncbi:hypothetical protein SPSYN_03106 [Sporotomaculum syntrophicum]|uniref:Uncharacterized protein n=1 Tax=Sporotomaculum syntrophicum TaxID=182264 RepID=A0A9D3AWG0_9FIRM|nr:hypothetical protein SPSYN_03106 [Sporotomaculum syntrophicum]
MRVIGLLLKQTLNGPVKKSVIHSLIQNRICWLAWEFGYFGRTEFVVEGFRSNGYNGKIEIAWLDSSSVPVAVFEIDSSPRHKSVQKLLIFNCLRFWVVYEKKILIIL